MSFEYPEEELAAMMTFPTKGMTPTHRKWVNSKGKLKGRDKKRVSRWGNHAYHAMERGTSKACKAKETLTFALHDYLIVPTETIPEAEDSYLTIKEKELEDLFCALHTIHNNKKWMDPTERFFEMEDIREEIRGILKELSYLK